MRARRVDANQVAIVEAFRRLGARVRVTSTLGDGFPDLAVAAVHGGRRRWHLVEVKDGQKPLSARRLTVDEQMFRDLCPEDHWLCESPEDARRLMAAWEAEWPSDSTR